MKDEAAALSLCWPGRVGGRETKLAATAHSAHSGTEGELRERAGAVRWACVGNYVDARAFPWRDRARGGGGRAPLTIGRLSRADRAKYPADFPRSYERLAGLGAGTRLRVMAWAPHVARL